jgi:hypothetical protein
LSSRDPTIRLPSSGGNKVRGKESGTEEEFKGAYSPTFVRLEERFKKEVLTIPLGRSRPVGARTDASNNYLQRTDNPGRILLDERIRQKFAVREHLKDGRLTLFFTPSKEDIEIGETFKIICGRPHGKHYFSLRTIWSAAVICPACWCGA